MAIRIKSAEPFQYHHEDGDKAVLLIHGFTGAPSEMVPLGEYLYEKGYSVNCPLLAGHGTSVEDMENTNWKDWVGTAEETLKIMLSKYKKVYLVGFSMGGCIATYLSMKYKVHGLVSISAPVFLTDRKAYFTPVLRYVRRYKPKPRKPDYGVPVFSYDKTPIKCVSSLLRLITLVRYNLNKVKVPTFVIQGEEDRVVRPISADYIYRKIKSSQKEIKYYPKRSHMITVENGRAEVISDIEIFISQL